MTATPSADADLRALLRLLIERWQQQLAEYEARAQSTSDRYAQYARIRATRIRSCIREVEIVLDTGHIPYDLMTNDELAERGLTRENAEIVELAEVEADR